MRNIFITYLAVLLSSGLFIYVDKNYNFHTKSNNRKTVNTEVNNVTEELNPVAEDKTETEIPVERNTIILEPTVINQSSNQVLLNSPVEELDEAPRVVAEPKVYIVGMDETTHYDSPLDNTIHFSINEEINSDSKVYLEYELYGLADYNSVCMSINDYISQGGMVVCTNQEWTTQVQEIAPYQVQKGQNSIVLNLPESFQGQYKLRNFNVRVEKSKKQEQLVIRQDELRSFYGEYAYVSGFVNDHSKNISIVANNIELDCYRGTFEGIIPVNNENEENTVLVEAYSGDELLESKTVSLENKFSYTYIQPGNREIDHVEMLAEPNMDFSLELPGISLNAPAGFIESSMSISVTGLRSIDMPLPDVAMINVTGESDGFRCLPHGSVFNEDMEIAVKYDTAAIPYGYGPEDIRTFYYDDVYEKWVMIPYDTVDIANNMIISKTNHFTDFINAILKTPELPTTEAFTPTSLKDLDYANPLAGINIMSPPVANNSGTANLSFPIQVPAGRQGMQPNLAVSYSSDGGSGMCGVGWTVNIPAITVDTRWGVPRYSDEFETEEYLVNGQQIVELSDPQDLSSRLPVIHMGTGYRDRANSNETHFAYRVEGQFDKIIRHGNSPDTYTWEIIDKNGTRYFYGKSSIEENVNPANVLSQPETGNIAKWMLKEVIDVHGNKMSYKYAPHEHILNPYEAGKQLYLECIFYTGYETDLGEYVINFIYSDKSDYSFSGNYGFLEINDKLIKGIRVQFQGQFVRAYAFNYETGVYGKTLLKSIADVTDETLLDQVTVNYNYSNPIQYSGATVHIFDYYKEDDIEFETEDVIISSVEEPNSFSNNIFGIDLEGDEQSLGRNHSKSYSFGGTIGFGLGADIFSKAQTIGGTYTYTTGNNVEQVSIMDINGDGLLDKLLLFNGQVELYKGYLNENNQLLFNNEMHIIDGLQSLGESSSKAHSFGGEVNGGDALPAVFASYNRNSNTESTNKYFEDINSDGFIDYVNNGTVFFNTPDQDGNPVFEIMGSEDQQEMGIDPCYSISYNGSVVDVEITDDEETKTRRDPVIMFKAPGPIPNRIDTYTLTCEIKRIEGDQVNNGIVFYTIDVYKNGSFSEDDRIVGVIEADNFDIHPIESSLRLSYGDVVYFRLHAEKNYGFDDIDWDIDIKGPNITMEEYDHNYAMIDANEDFIYSYTYKDEVVIQDGNYFTVPYDGTVIINSNLNSSGLAQSDDMHYTIFHYKEFPLIVTLIPIALLDEEGDEYEDEIVVESPNICNITYDSPIEPELQLVVKEGEMIKFKLETQSNIKWSNIDFFASIEYTSYDDPTNKPPLEDSKFYPSLDMSIYPNVVKLSNPVVFQADDHTVIPSLSFIEDFDATGVIVLTAKTNRKLLVSKEIPIVNGTLPADMSWYSISFNIPSDGTEVFFDYHTNIEDITPDMIIAADVKHIYAYNTYLYRAGFYSRLSDEYSKFGNFCRGWGQFSYLDGSNNGEVYPIDESLLHVNETATAEGFFENIDFNEYTDESTYEDAESDLNSNGIDLDNINPFAIMTADCQNNRWIDYALSAEVSIDRICSGVGAEKGQTEVFGSDETITEASLTLSPDYFEAPVINKMNKVINNSICIGSMPLANLGYTFTYTNTKGLSDFRDMNGDRYPDIVTTKSIQYSNAMGGISDDMLEFEEKLVSKANGYTHGASAGVKATLLENTGTSAQGNCHLDNLDGSFGVGANFSTSKSKVLYVDMNGDGLPDRVTESTDVINTQSDFNLTIEYNLGYGFSQPRTIIISDSDAKISKTNTNAGSLTINAEFLNKEHYSLAFGLGANGSTSNLKFSIDDINNDGLVDFIFVPAEAGINDLKALINTGSDFIPLVLYEDFDNKLAESKSSNIGSNFAGTLGFTIGLYKMTITGYADIGNSISRERSSFMDINADGAIDKLWIEGADIKAKFAIPQKANILRNITTPGLGTYTLDYKKSYPDIENPESKWLLTSLILNNGFDDMGDDPQKLYYTFNYENGKYHRLERESYGFAQVYTNQLDSFEDENVYRTTLEEYNNENYIFNGIKTREVTFDANNHPLIENIYIWKKKDILTGVIVPEDEAVCFGAFYPALDSVINWYYDATSANTVTTEKIYTHGSYGNIIRYDNLNLYGTSDDDVIAIITYLPNTDLYLMNLVDELHVYDNQSTLLRKSKGDYDEYGNLIGITNFYGDTHAQTSLYYDQYGNIERIENPVDANLERMTYHYTYDEVVHSYPVIIYDYWGNEMHTTYDYALGVPLVVESHTGTTLLYTYLPDGRIETITGPNEVINNIPYTIKYEYWDEVTSNRNFWAMTKHYDSHIQGNEFITVNISDGFGRIVQSKKTSEINGNYKVVVSGNLKYDNYNRLISSSQPSTENYDQSGIIQYSVFGDLNPTITVYDVLDRLLSVTAPDGTSVSYNYQIGTDAFGLPSFITEITDQNGHATKVFNNANNLQTTILQPLDVQTTFEYSPLGELLVSTDPENNSTLYEYDMLGRLTRRVHPDANSTNYTYDPAGNIITVQTENLNAVGELIHYEYEDCRLKQISYPLNPEMNVYYEYGTAGTGNQSGRLVKQQDASGVQTFTYGNMGEIIENIHTYVVPGGEAYTFKMQWAYDSWNRLLAMKYPDGETVAYKYDKGGDLYSMKGLKAGETFKYIDKTEYDKYGRKTHIEYGNGTMSDYSYNDLTLRLDNLISKESTGLLMQNLDYLYDFVGNIKQIDNTGDYVNVNFGGVFHYSFKYDDLNRLEESYGDFSSYGNGTMDYALQMTYSSSGNIRTKRLVSQNLINGGTNTISYSRKYAYEDRPHNVSSITGKVFEWDLNGNMIRRSTPLTANNERNLCWDEENRLLSVHDSGELNHISSYLYDAGGERTWKFSGPEVLMQLNAHVVHSSAILQKTLYASPFMVMTETDYTKHYFIEGERICSKIGGGFGSADFAPTELPIDFIFGNANSIANDLRKMVRSSIACSGFSGRFRIDDELIPAYDLMDNPENMRYFYHPDHLGSSSFITNIDGKTEEHIQYLPYGEIFVQQRTKSFDSRYKFTAKELDTETDYTYFGARYYDSDLSNWISVDPILDIAPSWTPYRYGFQNPVKYIDNYGLYESRNKAERKQRRLVRKMERHGKDISRIGEVYNRNAGTGKDEDWVFQVYCEGRSKEPKNSYTKTEPTIGADKPSGVVSNDAIYNSIKKNYLRGGRSIIEQVGETSDEIANKYIAPIVPIYFLPPTVVVNSFKTIITGSDYRGIEKKGVYQRVINPVISTTGAFNMFFGSKLIDVVDAINSTYNIYHDIKEEEEK